MACLPAAAFFCAAPAFLVTGRATTNGSHLRGRQIEYEPDLYDDAGRYVTSLNSERPASAGETVQYISFFPTLYVFGSRGGSVEFSAVGVVLPAIGGGIFGFRAVTVRHQTNPTPTFGAAAGANPSSAHDGMARLGAFSPFEAGKLLALLERNGINFTVEAGYASLATPNRFLFFYWGVFPDGSTIVVQVSENELNRVLELTKDLFPV